MNAPDYEFILLTTNIQKSKHNRNESNSTCMHACMNVCVYRLDEIFCQKPK